MKYYIKPAEKHIDTFCVYNAWHGDTFIVAAYGPMSLLTLTLALNHLSNQNKTWLEYMEDGNQPTETPVRQEISG